MNFNSALIGVLDEHGSSVLDEDEGFITCPGEDSHQRPTKPNDCRIFWNEDWWCASCFHGSCKKQCGALNHDLSRLQRNVGSGKPSKESVKAKKARHLTQIRLSKAVPDIICAHPWNYAQICSASPIQLAGAPEDHWRHMWGFYDDTDWVWAADEVWMSGKGHEGNIKPVGEWKNFDKCPGKYICPTIFNAGSTSRASAYVNRRKFLVVESDKLDRNSIGALFRWLNESLNLRLRAVVDTANKSLHGWFEFPDDELLAELEFALVHLGCDPALLKPSQPCRMPGAVRDGNYQRLIYLSC